MLLLVTELNLFPPSFSPDTPARKYLAWNLVDAVIIRVVASDNDTGPNASLVKYSLTAPSYPLPFRIADGRNMFTINATTGVISLSGALSNINIEQVSQFLLTIKASDEGEPPLSTLHVMNFIPIPVPFYSSQHETAIEVDEETAIGSTVAVLVCDELGPSSDSLKVTLNSTAPGLIHILEGHDLEIARRIDFESLSEAEKKFNITATCSNRFNLTVSFTLDVTINNIDDNVFKFEHARYNLEVYENVTVNELVATLVAYDRDVPDANITYSFEASSNVTDFDIDPSTGQLLVLSSLDRETESVYNFTAHADYTNLTGGVERASSVVIINITDINDESPRFSNNLYVIRNLTSVDETGEFVFQVIASDADMGSNGEVTYSLLHELFEINETTGDIFTTAPLSYGLYMLDIYASDRGEVPNYSQTTLYINVVAGIPERILLTLGQSPVVVEEDAPTDSFVVPVHFSVVDNNDIALTTTSAIIVYFEIVNASVPDYFVINETTGEIFTSESFDYETLAREYVLIIGATFVSSDNDLYNETLVIINIENINDTPPQFSSTLYATAVEQYTLPNTSILTVSAYDPDNLGNISYFISSANFSHDLEGSGNFSSLLPSDNTSFFHIDVVTGEVFTSIALNSPQDYWFSVVARDGGEEESMAAVYISVSESPVFADDEVVFSVLESASPGTLVGTVAHRRDGFLDSLGEISFRIPTPNLISFNTSSNFNSTDGFLNFNLSQNWFHVDPVTGNITTLNRLDYERQQLYTLSVEIYNNDTEVVYDIAEVEIVVEDVNDNSPVFAQDFYTRVIYDYYETNSSILVVSATDRDSGNNSMITYSLEQEDRDLEFTVNPTTGEIAVSNSTLVPGDYNLTVSASDEGIPSLISQVSAYITVVQFVPEDIEFAGEPYLFHVVEDAEDGTLVGIISAMDTNSSIVPPSIVYYLPNNITDCFNVDMEDGEFTVSCTSLDRERVSSYELEIIAEVDNTTAYGIIRISILDINDNEPVFSLDVYTKILNDDHDILDPIVQVFAEDPDYGPNGTVVYSLASETNLFIINATSGELFLANETIEVDDYSLSVHIVANRPGLPWTVQGFDQF